MVQGKARLSTSTFRVRQPNEGLSDVQTSLRFERRSRTSLAVHVFSNISKRMERFMVTQ